MRRKWIERASIGRATIFACVALLVVLQSLFAAAAPPKAQHSAIETAALSSGETTGVVPLCNSSRAPNENDHCDHAGCFICASSTDREFAVFVVAATLSIMAHAPDEAGVAPLAPDGLRPTSAFPKGPGAPRAPPHIS